MINLKGLGITSSQRIKTTKGRVSRMAAHLVKKEDTKTDRIVRKAETINSIKGVMGNRLYRIIRLGQKIISKIKRLKRIILVNMDTWLENRCFRLFLKELTQILKINLLH